jgi:CheY-like chemotaxis protein
MSDALKGRIHLEKAAILLLCPEQGMRVLARVLQGFGMRHPILCHDSAKAMAACAETDLDMIICDGSLECGEAYDFVAELRRSDLEPNRFAPVMILQGHTPIDQIQKARDCGANFVVAKPINPLLLLERILWVAQESRPFVELDGYVGPDRRFHDLGPPGGPGTGRRRSDKIESVPKDLVNAEDSLL